MFLNALSFLLSPSYSIFLYQIFLCLQYTHREKKKLLLDSVQVCVYRESILHIVHMFFFIKKKYDHDKTTQICITIS